MGRVWDREDRDRQGTEKRKGARIRDWVSVEVFLWLQPKVSQGSVPSPEAATARAESGESFPRVQEGHRGTEVAGSRVAGGWQGDREPEVARSEWVSHVGHHKPFISYSVIYQIHTFVNLLNRPVRTLLTALAVL